MNRHFYGSREGKTMKQHNSAYFRRNMARLLIEVDQTSEPLLVTTNKGEDQYQRTVVISEEQYIMMINQINGGK